LFSPLLKTKHLHCTIIFPHQLFEKQPALQKDRKVFIVEEFLYYSQYSFHKQKLVLHRASMKWYEHTLLTKNHTVEYIEATDKLHDVRKLITHLAKQKITAIHIADVTDDWLQRRLATACKKNDIQLHIYPTPGFLNDAQTAGTYFDNRKTYFQTNFYIAQRKQKNLLLEDDGKPMGGKWSFDAENRLKFPKHEEVPAMPAIKQNEFVTEAINYVEKYFKKNYGNANEFIYPVTHKDTEKWLHDFLKYRFVKFGMYEDAMVKDESYLYHAVLTPMLNIGLITPQQVIDEAMHAAAAFDIPLNSLEGFTRQVIGWREFIHLVYRREGRRQRTTNYWKFKRKIPATFWKGETGIEPLDIIIKRLLNTGYTHHIERLMVLGNFMLLCEFDPDDVYKWFMEMYADSYDWVMVPNVYGMTQFADGGLITTKPYISGSNYLMKMGNWPKGPWQQVWDGLFWRFMHVHRNFFLQNPRLGMLINTFDKMEKTKQQAHLKNAADFLKQLDEG
jgi:deoxyribodipyrimidine photolyase-related protein